MSNVQRFTPIQPIEASPEDLTARLDALQVPRQPVPPVAAKPAAKPAGPLKKVSLQIPEYLWDELHVRARKQRCSVRHAIMKSLLADGYVIKSTDMIEDGRKVRG